MAPVAQRVFSVSAPLPPSASTVPTQPTQPIAKSTTISDSTKVRFQGHESSQNEWAAPSSGYSAATLENGQEGTDFEMGSEETLNDTLEEEEASDRAPLHGQFILHSLKGNMLKFPCSLVEVRLLPKSTIRYDLIRSMMHAHLDAEYDTILTHSEVHDWRDVVELAENVDRVWIGECCASPFVSLPSCDD